MYGRGAGGANRVVTTTLDSGTSRPIAGTADGATPATGAQAPRRRLQVPGQERAKHRSQREARARAANRRRVLRAGGTVPSLLPIGAMLTRAANPGAKEATPNPARAPRVVGALQVPPRIGAATGTGQEDGTTTVDGILPSPPTGLHANLHVNPLGSLPVSLPVSLPGNLPLDPLTSPPVNPPAGQPAGQPASQLGNRALGPS
mmetsp:Transcript_34243/g.65221  ORF Transcript_34243/g.65221 Transcript_34243/m.65221 type:complete len:203 (+) Transcript_34243:340-948(+)